MECTLQQLAERIAGQLEGDGDCVVRGMASLDAARDDEVSFLANARYTARVAETSAAAVIVSEDYDGPGTSLIRCKDPYFGYREAMVAFYGFREHPFEGISQQAVIDPSASLGEGVRVAAFATIGPDVSIGAGTVIYPGVCIGPGCRIGRDCVLYPNVALYDGCLLGDRVTVHAGSSIGQDGFGYATHPNGKGEVTHQKIPQAGWVVLEDDVEIGACCAIDRATMGATIIGAGTKFSNHISIGHGTRLGKHCLMVAQSGIAGSTTVGGYCSFGGQAGVVGHINIGDQVRVGAQAGVTNDLSSNLEVLGSPARPRAEARRVVMAAQKLPELRSQVKMLQREVKQLRQELADRPDTPPENAGP